MTHLWATGEALRVDVDAEGAPLRLIWRGRAHPVESITRHWRVDVEWWRVRIWRDYFKLVTTTGLLVVIYRDFEADGWYLQRLYD